MLLDPQSNNWLYQLWQRLTASRAAALDNLDVTVGSRQSAMAASTQFSTLSAQMEAAGLQRARIFATPGSWSFTVPSGVSFLTMSACGGGGGGAKNVWSTAHGGGGAAIYRMPLIVVPGEVISFVVGAAGASASTTTDVGLSGTAGGSTGIRGFSVAGGGGGSTSAGTGAGLVSNGIGGGWGSNFNRTIGTDRGSTPTQTVYPPLPTTAPLIPSPFVDGTSGSTKSTCQQVNGAYWLQSLGVGISALDGFNGGTYGRGGLGAGQPTAGAVIFEWWGPAS